MLMLFLEQARGRPTWSLRATWSPREPRWWPLTKMRADIKGPHLDFFGGVNRLSHGSVTLYADVERFFLWCSHNPKSKRHKPKRKRNVSAWSSF